MDDKVRLQSMIRHKNRLINTISMLQSEKATKGVINHFKKKLKELDKEIDTFIDQKQGVIL